MIRKSARSSSQKSNFTALLGPLAVTAVFVGIVSLFNIILHPTKTVCANSISCTNDLSGAYVPNAKGVFNGKTVTPPSDESLAENPNQKVLGSATGGEKHIYVDLTHQWLQAKEGDTVVMQFPVSTGKWHPTPAGDFHIWIKLRYARMTGGNPAIGTFYDLPNVPYTMYFYNTQVPKTAGYGLHGAYWHNNFGHPMSHGCVNISPANAALLYNWAEPANNGNSVIYPTVDDPGTAITIYGAAPASEVAYVD